MMILEKIWLKNKFNKITENRNKKSIKTYNVLRKENKRKEQQKENKKSFKK